MVELRKEIDLKTGETSLVINKRTLSKVSNPPHIKDLRYSRILPIACNDCPYKPTEEGGNGLCKAYVKDSACRLRGDIRDLVRKFKEQDAGKLIEMLEAAFENNFEKLMFFEMMEDQTGKLDPEVTKRQNSMTNMFKIINEAKTKRESIEITKTETLSEDMKRQIAQTVKLTREIPDNEP